jgi:hypothetical protein
MPAKVANAQFPAIAADAGQNRWSSSPAKVADVPI